MVCHEVWVEKTRDKYSGDFIGKSCKLTARDIILSEGMSGTKGRFLR
jgi:hypothetical protein